MNIQNEHHVTSTIRRWTALLLYVVRNTYDSVTNLLQCLVEWINGPVPPLCRPMIVIVYEICELA